MMDDTFVQAERWKRDLTIQQAYWLREKLDRCRSENERDGVLEAAAAASGLSLYKIRDMARWTEHLRRDDLVGAFAEAGIAGAEWLERITASHLDVLKDVRDQKTFRLPTSQERAAILVEAYHANWSVDDMKAELIERGLLPAPKGMPSRPLAPGTLTLGQLLVQIGQEMQRSGHDDPAAKLYLDLTQPQPIHKLLWLIQERYGRLHPTRMITVKRPKP
jgi:hypothetical protein